MKHKYLYIVLILTWLGTGQAWAAKNFNVLNGPNSYLFVNGTSGNVGISSTAPGQLLDVQGTVRATGFALTTGASSGYVLTSNSVGVGTWAPAGGGGLWNTTNTNDVYEENGSTFGNVGIGTSITNAGAALSVMNGNVGIGTWAPSTLLSVNGPTSSSPVVSFQGSCNGCEAVPLALINPYSAQSTNSVLLLGNYDSNAYSSSAISLTEIAATGSNTATAAAFTIIANDKNTTSYSRFLIDRAGNIGIGTSFLKATGGGYDVNTSPTNKLTVVGNVGIGTNASSAYVTVNSAPNGGMIVEGNVGLGSLTPGTQLDVQGTVRATGFALTTGASSGYVLTSNSVGVGTWAPAGGGGLWNTTNTNDVYEENGSTFGNVGIGTSITNAGAALSVMNGNVGIGTWAPQGPLHIEENSTNEPVIINDAGETAPGIGGNYMETEHANGVVNYAGALEVINNFGNDTIASIDVGVAGNANTSKNNYGIILQRKVTGALGWAQTGAVTTGAYLPAIGFAGQTNTTPGTGMRIGASIQGQVEGTVSSNVLPTGLLFNTSLTDSTGLTERMRIASNGNIGIGTSVPAGALDVEGTIYPVVFYGRGTNYNVGIGSLTPGSALDVQGTVRATGFALTTGASSGYVLTSNSVGVGTWAPAGGGGLWNTTNTNDVYEENGSTFGNVGIGTSITNAGAALSVMNGNVGIGTWTNLKGLLIVKGGNVGLGTNLPGQMLDVQGTVRDIGEIVNGNVGIGSAVPGQALDVQGNIRASGTITSSMSYATLTDGATITWTVAGIINNAVVTLGGNRTLAFSGLTNGMSGTLVVKQDATGSRTLALPTQCTDKVVAGGGGSVTLSTSASAIDVLTFSYDGTNCYWTYGTNFS